MSDSTWPTDNFQFMGHIYRKGDPAVEAIGCSSFKESPEVVEGDGWYLYPPAAIENYLNDRLRNNYFCISTVLPEPRLWMRRRST